MGDKNPWVLITGACGDIGQAMVNTFNAKGYRVIATDLVPPSGNMPYEHFIQVDLEKSVLNEEYATELFQQIRDLLPEKKLNALVNNAAVQILGSSEQLSRESWQETLNVNLLAPFFWSQALLPELENGKGSIVNISSIHATLTKADFVAYATSKAALSAMTRNMAVDIKRKIRINAIEPAAVSTKMLEQGFAESQLRLEDLETLHPIGRIASPAEIANAALFLCSKDASFIHGSCITVSGGIHNCLLDPIL
jgi:NAD(P)-dependent dehydrogenase (short-subunit alcohol dehydrogenase family)